MTDQFRVLMVGRVARIKRVEDAIQALATIGTSDGTAERDVVLDIVGPLEDREYVRELEALVQRLDLTSRVRFWGPVEHGEQLWEWYRRADALLMTSASEGTPKVLPEAMSKGLPLILPRLATLEAAFGGDDCVAWFDPGSIHDLCSRILDLATDPAKRMTMGEYALHECHKFTSETTLALLRAALIEAVTAGAG